MADETAEIIPFPRRPASLSVVYKTVEQLQSDELLFVAQVLITLAVERYAAGNDGEFYVTAHPVFKQRFAG